MDSWGSMVPGQKNYLCCQDPRFAMLSIGMICIDLLVVFMDLIEKMATLNPIVHHLLH